MQGGGARVGELAPAMNRAVKAARDRGVLIIHAPSSCMEAYKTTRLASGQAAPKAANLPADIDGWCTKIPAEESGIYPIDQADGGCDDGPRCPEGSPWRSQIAAIEIRDEDAISDSGVEIWNLLESRGISHYTGHHANELKPKVTTAKGAESHPIMAGVQTPFTGQGSLYKTGPLAASARALLLGEIAGHPVKPVAWVNLVGSSRVFYTSLGHPGDFDNTAFRRLLRNAVFWAMNRHPSGGPELDLDLGFDVAIDQPQRLAAPIQDHPRQISTATFFLMETGLSLGRTASRSRVGIASLLETLASCCLTSYHSRIPGWVKRLAVHGTPSPSTSRRSRRDRSISSDLSHRNLVTVSGI